MYWQASLHKNISFLLLLSFIVYCKALTEGVETTTPAATTPAATTPPTTTPAATTPPTTAPPTTTPAITTPPTTKPPITTPPTTKPPITTVPTTVTTPKKTTKYYTKGYKDRNKKKSRKYGSGNMRGYYNNDGDYYYNEKTGKDGIDPRRLGTDIGDFGPVYERQPPMAASLDIFIRYADDWESDLKYRQKGRGGYSNRKQPYSDNKRPYSDNKRPYSDNKRPYSDKKYSKPEKKESYSRVHFPVRHYPDVKKFPRERFPPLISIFPWLPIFYDRITYQTIIFSPTGGLYIIPPIINFYGKRFAVAQLIKWGYASLVSSGIPPEAGLNVAPLVQPAPVGGAPAVGFNAGTGRFTGGVKMGSSGSGPKYPQKIYKREIVESGPSSAEN